MDYTISFDASLKVKKGQEKGFINHLARDVFDNENGYSLQHKNENINKDLTNQNQTFVNNGNGTFKNMESLKEATDYLDERLGTVKKTLRKDAVIARPLIFQLDSRYVETHSEDDVAKYFNHMLVWAANEFGIDNLVCGSMHMDETSPHMHLMFTPVTEDGRLAQKDWFKNPATLKKQHNDLRQYMRDNDYNATYERATVARKGLPIEDFKAVMNMTDKVNEVKNKELELQDKEMDLKARKTDLDERKEDLDTLDLKTKQNALNAEKEAQRVIDEAQREAQRKERQAEAILREAEAIREQAEIDAKKLRAGARATGRKVDNIASNANEITQRDKRLKGLQSQFGDLGV